VEGPAAWDFWTAFEQHWRHQLSEHVDELLRLDQARGCTKLFKSVAVPWGIILLS